MNPIYLTVQEMIEQGGFSDFLIHAGADGLTERAVRTICVVDSPDLEGWLFGGEFLLSSGYIFREQPERLAPVIESAHRANAAALGIKMERYIDRIPQEILRLADRLSFPLIGIPLHYAHTDIINPALIAIADSRAQQMDRRDEIWQSFFDRILSGASIEEILALLKRLIERNVLYLDVPSGRRHTASDSPDFDRIADEVPLASLIDHFPYETVELNGSLRGYIFVERDIPDHDARTALMQARCALQLHARWESERWKIERGRGEMFVQDILFKRFRHDSEIRSRGRTLGWELSGLHAVVLIAIDPERSLQQEPHEPHARAYEIFYGMLRKLQPSIPHTHLEDSMAFILQTPRAHWRDIRTQLEELFTAARRQARLKTGLQLVMGVGAPVDNMLACDKSFWEAKRTLAMGHVSEGVSAPLFWEDMGVYKLLAPILGTPEAASFVREQLGPLLESTDILHSPHSPHSDETLLHTLFCVIRNNWQLKPVAREMSLHYNTVKYRYRKIETALAQDLESQPTRLNLAMAMELYMLARAERAEKNKISKDRT